MNRLLPIGLAAALALAGCHSQMVGNGVLGQQARVVAPFDAVDISLAIEATVTADAAAPAVTLSGDENLLQYVLTPVEAGVLSTRLHGTSGIEPVHPLRLAARTTSLHLVRASQAALVEVSGAGDPGPTFTFEVEASGASHVVLRGSGGHGLLVNLSGASTLDARSFAVAGASLAVGGASTLQLRSASDPSGVISGASRVELSGGATCAALTLSGGATCTAN
jgi:hypothetical protein